MLSYNAMRDLRYGWRGIRRAPSFSCVVILTLALGLGANTAIFSVVRAVLLKPLPYWFYSVLDQPAPARNDVPVALVNIADPAYFRTMGIPLREGRDFAGADRAGAPAVAIVNETFARK